MFSIPFHTDSDSSGRIVNRNLASDPVTVVAIVEDLMLEDMEGIPVAVIKAAEGVMEIPPVAKSISEMFARFSYLMLTIAFVPDELARP